MSRYDDERIVALLHDAVPPVPDTYDRVAGIRHRAGRQRAAIWTQTLGAVASVLVVIGLAAAVSNAGTTSATATVQPVDDPLAAFGEALADLTSVRFEGSMEPVGPVDTRGMTISPEQAADLLASHVVGAFAANGDFELSGDLSFLDLFALAGQPQTKDVRFKYVDDVAYRTPFAYETLPPGKRWIRTEGATTDPAVLVQQVRVLQSLAEDVHYVRGADVRGEPVAEYQLTVPKGIVPQAITLTFALDAKNRLRRLTGVLSLRDMFSLGDESSGAPVDPLDVRLETVFYGYGDDIRVAAPPRSEVVDEDGVESVEGREITDVTEISDEQLKKCAQEAGADAVKFQVCTSELGMDGAFSAYATAAPAP